MTALKQTCSTVVALTFLGLLIFTQFQGQLPVTKLDTWLFPLQAWTFNTVSYRMYAPFPAYQRDLPSISVSAGAQSRNFSILDRALIDTVMEHFKETSPRLTRATAERWGNFMLSISNGLQSSSPRYVGYAKHKFEFLANLFCNRATHSNAQVSWVLTAVEFGRFMQGPKFGESRSALIFDCATGKFVE